MLSSYTRPTVKFDPSNAQHRKWLGDFTRQSKWGNCPVHLVPSKGTYGNPVALMTKELLNYYINNEFSTES